MNTRIKLLTFFIINLVFISCGGPKSELTPEHAKSLAKEAYIYAFPAVEHNKAIWKIVGDSKNVWNTMWVEARLFSPADTTVVSPNNDTYYCPAVLDIRHEPVVFSVPEMKDGRDFLIQLLDIFTNCPDYISKLATGDGPGNYMVARSDWDGETPAGIDTVIKIPATVVLALGRIQVYGPEDEEALMLGRQFRITPLSSFAQTQAPPADTLQWTAKSYDAKTGDVEGFFNMFNYIIQYQILNESDKKLMDKYESIGLGVREKFSKSDFPAKIWKAIEEGAAEAKAEIRAKTDHIGKEVNGWQFSPENAGRWGTDYLTNAAAAWKYIYVNTPEEALYLVDGVDISGDKFNGSANSYTLSFREGQLPQAKFFWSLTIYGQKGYLKANDINRYAINSSSDVKYAGDGSLTIYIRKDHPGKDKESNWLPAPDEEFYMILRMYGPTEDVISGRWQIPAVVKVN
ncbi:MAG: DUF1214 domain-containing protein [Bacteroidales bacterium]|jgi:hypothetical protein|nr:DUF1214 domain-containing protein [Bacteroidales bacterium]